jgi:ribosomal-protein-alanine N-acetyltransferase
VSIFATIKIPTLETPHLFLRPWVLEDADAWFNILNEEGILQYFPNQIPPTHEKAEGYIRHHLSHWRMRGYGHWAVVLKEDNQIVGWCGLEYLTELNQTELAYLLSKRTWGRGYGTEAAKASVKFGFETAKLEQIIGLVHPENTGSVRVLEKCGLSLVDRIPLWGLEMCRYRVFRSTYDNGRIT